MTGGKRWGGAQERLTAQRVGHAGRGGGCGAGRGGGLGLAQATGGLVGLNVYSQATGGLVDSWGRWVRLAQTWASRLPDLGLTWASGGADLGLGWG